MSMSQTSRKVGGQHIHVDRLGGGAVNGHLFWQHFIFVAYATYSDFLWTQGGAMFPHSMYSKFAPDDHGTRFSTWRRSEDIVSRVTCGDQGGMWCV